MSKGLTLPFQTNVKGDLLLTEGPDLLRQNIMTALIPASSAHPWNQKLTPREDIIFDIADSKITGEMIAHIYDYFDELRKLNLAMLSHKSDAIKVTALVENSGDVELSITYVDLEDQRSREIRIKGGK